MVGQRRVSILRAVSVILSVQLAWLKPAKSLVKLWTLLMESVLDWQGYVLKQVFRK